MSRQLNPLQVWSQVPVANRLIEVNTKTGFSLTAGSYVSRATDAQRISHDHGGNGTETESISSVTLARTQEVGSFSNNTNTANPEGFTCGYAITAATTISYFKDATDGSSGNVRTKVTIEEKF